MKIESRLLELCKRNVNSNYLNDRLYRLLFSEDLYLMAYENIKSNTGILTKGVSSYSMDGVSMVRIRKLIKSLTDESYQPQPCRRVLIPKTNGKFRPLGLPDANDKLVQEAVRIILECIYDSSEGATFSKYSFGFRKGLGCHDALKSVYDQFRKCAWIIKADIKGFFDNVDHVVLINLLRKRINDERFVRLIWKFLRAGIMWEGQFQKTLKGTPQGGIISPMLANIYLHEFDQFVEQMKQEKGTITIPSLEYGKCVAQKKYYKIKLKKLPLDDKHREAIENKIVAMESLQMNLPSRILKDPDKGEIKYVRYADDWMIAVKGSKAFAEEIYNLSHQFYEEKLKLSWNQEKSKLIKTTDEETEFLGTLLCFRNRRQTKYIDFVTRGVKSKKRSVGINTLVLNMPKQIILQRLKERGFLEFKNGEYKPKHMTKLLSLSDYEIVQRYNAVTRGIGNYYSFCNNPKELAHIKYLMSFSLVKTIANKHKTASTNIWKKYGKNITVPSADNRSTISFTPIESFKRKPMNFKTKLIKNENAINFLFWELRSKKLLKDYGCAVCGTHEDNIEMHHVKHIKKTDVKYEGFDKIMGYINRKQIPVCKKCHHDIHHGLYDDVALKEFADQIAIRIGIKKPV